MNKHRNVEITSPSIHDIATPITVAHPLNPPRRVTIGDESMSKIFHYEVESDFEDDEVDRYEETHYDKEEGAEYQDANEDEFQEMIMDSYTSEQQEVKQEWQEKSWDDEESKQSMEETQIPEQGQDAPETNQQQQNEEDVQAMELRVFAGNIGQGPLFHSFSITASTTADELIQSSVSKFGMMMDTQALEDTTIEYYIAVQGMDGGTCCSFSILHD